MSEWTVKSPGSEVETVCIDSRFLYTDHAYMREGDQATVLERRQRDELTLQVNIHLTRIAKRIGGFGSMTTTVFEYTCSGSKRISCTLPTLATMEQVILILMFYLQPTHLALLESVPETTNRMFTILRGGRQTC